jgi:putative addiction module component (TIGR02574 family)
MLETMTIEEILKQALELPPKERAKLAEDLLESLDDQDVDEDQAEKAWSEEIRRRVDEIQSGAVKGVTWSEVQRRVRDTLNKARGR